MPMWMIVVLLGIVIILYASMLPRAQAGKAAPDEFLDSVGDTLQHFVEEIEEENKELVSMIANMKREHESRTGALMQRIEQLERQSADVRDQLKRSAAPSPGYPDEEREPDGGIQAAQAPEPPLPAAARFANTVRARHKELFELYESGKSIEYIAKKLGKNKGEVQLIIGLAKQEEPLHGQP